jgi:antirestriction protein ArdC
LSASKFVSPFWLTLKQANQLGGLVRKGEQSTMIVFWKVDQAPNDDEPNHDENGPKLKTPIPSQVLSGFQGGTI